MIFFDVDGCVGNFERWVLSKDRNAFKIDHKHKNAYRLTTVLLQNYKEAFLVSETIPAGIALLQKHYLEDVKFLTALPARQPFLDFYPYLAESYKENGKDKDIDYIFHVFARNKINWCKTMLGADEDQVILVNSHKEKLNYCKQGAILYDDNPHTIAAWNALGGDGRFVKFSNIEWLDVEGQAK